MIKRILLTGGGTGGSVSPLLALHEHLRRQDPTIEWLFLGSADGREGSLCGAVGLPFQSIPAGKFRRYWTWKNVTDLGRVWSGWVAARRIIATWKPDVVVSAGSYISVPVIWAAKRAGCRILIHQQDIRPGLANRFMTNAADIITVSFEKSLKDFPSKKVRVTGNPVRGEILRGSKSEGAKIFSLIPNRPTLLVVGGSTGAAGINKLVGAIAARLVQQWQIIHLTGQRTVVVDHQLAGYQQHTFLDADYPHALAAADLVITRAGLGAISELAAISKAAIFIPLPGTHQIENARLIQKLGAGLVVDEQDLSESRLIELLEQVRQEPSKTTEWSKNIHQLYRSDAAQTIGKYIMTLLNQ